MTKIIILNQCTLDPLYNDVDKAMRETWQQVIHPNIRIINYYGSDTLRDKQCVYSPDSNKLIINVGDFKDNYIDENRNEYEFDSRGEKFILALEYCLNNLKFDFIYRMSCTSYIDIFKMYDYINTTPAKEKVYNGTFNMYNYKHYFVSGFNVIMSKDIVEQLINNKNQFLNLQYPEDVATGMIIFDHLKYLEDFNTQNLLPTYTISDNICEHPSLILSPSSIFNFKFPYYLSNNFNDLHNFLKNNSLKHFYYNLLKELKGIGITDKGTVHDYINSYYGNEFVDRNKKIKLVEIGIACGSSIKLWRDWFTNAEIFGFDINLCGNNKVEIEGTTLIYQDAYISESVNMFEDESLDYVIDDGPHNLQSQKDTIMLYLPKLKKGGKIIIEDVGYIEWGSEFIKLIKENLLDVNYKLFDLRENKGRYDDIIFELTKK
jgi:hypothetical protein